MPYCCFLIAHWLCYPEVNLKENKLFYSTVMTNIFRDGENSAVSLDDYSEDGCGQRYERATSSSGESCAQPCLPLSCIHPALPATLSLWSQSGTQLMAEGPTETDVKIGMKCVCVCVTEWSRAREREGGGGRKWQRRRKTDKTDKTKVFYSGKYIQRQVD